MIEFLVAFIFSVGFLFLFISLGLNFTAGYMAHYATFMASRTYLTGGNDSKTATSSDVKAEEQARAVYDRLKVKIFGVNGSLVINEPPSGGGEKYEYVGAKLEFDRDLSMIGFGGGDQKLHLVSESYLGREPTRADCLSQICNNYQNCAENVGDVHITIEDNGC